MCSRKANDTQQDFRGDYNLMYQSPQKIPWRIEGANKQFYEVLLKKNIDPPMKVLDLGCGAGKNTKYLEKKGFEVVGLDFSSEAIRLARRQKIKSPLILGTAIRLPFKDKTFDFIVDIGCFHCLPPVDQDRARDEVLRVLKSKGLYFLRLWHSSKNIPEILMPKFYMGKIPIWGFNKSLIKSIFLKHYKLEYISKEMDEDGYGPFLILLLRKIK
jgi:ubiquinone/menaquinone biosynthesis C-methylase UbiE